MTQPREFVPATGCWSRNGILDPNTPTTRQPGKAK
jgi:hypothetical protein